MDYLFRKLKQKLRLFGLAIFMEKYVHNPNLPKLCCSCHNLSANQSVSNNNDNYNNHNTENNNHEHDNNYNQQHAMTNNTHNNYDNDNDDIDIPNNNDTSNNVPKK